MSTHITLLQFLPPWRSISGVARYRFNSDLELRRTKKLKARKAWNKTAKNIDGLVLRPIWPSRKSLVLANLDGQKYLFEMNGETASPGTTGINIDDPSFQMQILERGLYRRFVFSNDQETYIFRDLSGRLIGPQRTAFEVFPEDDFSAFARLIGILRDSKLRKTLFNDFGRHRFKYSKWIASPNKESVKVFREELLN